MFGWLRRRRRQKILQNPFPPEWKSILENKLVHYRYLDTEEKERLRQMVQVFAEEKNFEILGGLEESDEIVVLVSAQACMLILALDHDLYRKVDSILIYPSAVTPPKRLLGEYMRDGEVVDDEVPLLGEAHFGGPVILVWDAVKKGAFHPERGHNVVYHEFAHKLDMLDGTADGVPPLQHHTQYETWSEVFTSEYVKLVRRSERGLTTLLDAYGATNPAEFFAVATESFFDKPVKLKKRHPALYEALMGFYNQDTARRVRRARR